MLVRLRADPEKVRIGVKRVWVHESGEPWFFCVKVESRDERFVHPPNWCISADVGHAIDRALQDASRAGIPGIDLDCSRAYDHPQHPPAKGRIECGVPSGFGTSCNLPVDHIGEHRCMLQDRAIAGWR